MDLNLTKSINKNIELSFINLYKKKEDYYNHVLSFFNHLLSDGQYIQNFNSILKIKFNFITLNSHIISLYNNIISNFNISADLINISSFHVNLPHNIIINLSIFMANNLLKPLNYKIISFYSNQHKLFKISKL